MPLIPFMPPPGVIRRGTQYATAGRWYDSQLVRFVNGEPQAWGGWASAGGLTSLGTPVRGTVLPFRRSTGLVYVGFGTRTNLYVLTGSTRSSITPAGFTSGAADASGTYYNRTEAHTWQLDTFGEDLVACSYSDGRIVVWDSSVGVGTPAAVLSGAPTGCKGVVVTNERFIFALGASSDRRLIAWPDQDTDITNWTPAAENQAGDYTLDTQGEILAGRKGVNETLIWTDKELWVAKYIGGTLVYSFTSRGENCGAVSRHAMTVFDGIAVWMGKGKFFIYDGAVRELPCDVADWLFPRINRAQASKIFSDIRADFHEVTWYFPGPGQTEISESVSYNWKDDVWSLGAGGLIRTAGCDTQSLLEFPIMFDEAGVGYEHENGTAMAGMGSPYIESGPVELEQGDRFVFLRQFIPAEDALGEVVMRIYTRNYPTETEVTNGPYTMTNPTDLLLNARQFRVRFTQSTAGWRIGKGRFDVLPSDGR